MTIEVGGAAQPAPRFVPLTVQQHGSLRLRENAGYGFTRTWNAVPLVLPELAEAAAHFPIVFMPGNPPTLGIVLGAETNRNSFVDDAGAWAAGAYLPAVIRQQPFNLVASGNPDQFTVVIDEQHELLSRREGDLVFEGSALGRRAEEIVTLCREMQGAAAATRAYVDAVIAAGLLEQKAAPFLRADGSRGFVQGLAMVDRAKLLNLPDATVLDWHRRGWLGATYLHLASERRWPALFERAGLRVAPADTQ